MLNAAIYGMGNWAGRLIDSVKASDKIRIVKGISRNPDKHSEFTAKTGTPVVSSYADVLKDPQIDAVVLATPHSLHHDHIVAAARAGKHVFCEKPLTLTRATAEAAVAACRAAGVTLGLGFNRRYTPAFLEMSRRISAGEIGEVLHIEGQHSGPSGYRLKAGNWRATRAESPGGGMAARGIHTLDSMIHIAGLVNSVYAHSGKLLWMARATSSLPVPLSPVMRIVDRLGAAWAMSSKTCVILGLRPMMPENLWCRRAASPLSWVFSSRSRRCSIALRRTTSTSSFLNGLVM